MLGRRPVHYPDEPVDRLLLRHAAHAPGRTALHLPEGDRTVTFGEVARDAAALAAGLRQLGIRRGDRVALFLPNGAPTLVGLLGTWRAGAAVVPINPSCREAEVEHILADADARLVLAGGGQWPIVEALPGHPPLVVAAPSAPAAIVRLDDLPAAHDGAAPPGPTAGGDDLALLPYSSGTTGRPKAVMLTHRNLVATLVQFGAALAAGPRDLPINFLPLSHIYGLMVAGVALAAGAAQVLLERYDLDHVLELIVGRRATMLFAVPPVIAALAERNGLEQHDLSSLRFVNTGAAPQSPEVLRRVAERSGVPVITGYGLTEAAPVAHTPVEPLHIRPGTVGVPVNDTEVRVVDDTAGTRTLLAGEVGELVVRGPQVMRGYLNAPEATAAALRAGWLYTGDLATLDADGFVSIVGRKKELIKVKGFSVAPAELEAVLLEHPAVADCAVVGRPDSEAGEVPVAYVVRRAGASVAADELQAFGAARLADYKRLRAVAFVPAIPRSPVGKVQRDALR